MASLPARRVHDVEIVVMRQLLELFRSEVVGEEVSGEVAIGEEVHGVADPHRIAVVAVLPRQLLDGVVREIHDPHRVRPPAAVVPPKTRLVPIGNERRWDFLIGDALAVGRELSAECARHRQRLLEAAVDRNAPQPEIRRLRRAGAIRGEEHALAVRRPSAHAIASGVIGQTPRLAARRGDDVHVGVVPRRATERDQRSVGREARIVLDVGRGGDASSRAPPARDVTQRSPPYSNAMDSRLIVGCRRSRVPCAPAVSGGERLQR